MKALRLCAKINFFKVIPKNKIISFKVFNITKDKNNKVSPGGTSGLYLPSHFEGDEKPKGVPLEIEIFLLMGLTKGVGYRF